MLFQNNSMSSLDIGLDNRQSDADTVWGQAMKSFKSTKKMFQFDFSNKLVANLKT